jgi:hypothetical protein
LELYLQLQNSYILGKIEKLIDRLLRIPRDFTWDELKTVLGHFGYKEFKAGKTGGSRRRFMNESKNIITLHKPHPDPTLKEYQLKDVIDHLREKGKLK